tara:strand:+ start:40 stop:1443 length:1404 start_codon:yes stop_codon:yes gene_type:complete
LKEKIHVIGGGLAGSEAAWQIARRGVPSILYEMRPNVTTEAHHTGKFAELVCSNSFRSDDHHTNAVGVLHQEMRKCGSLIMLAADKARVPAGSALAVDRDHFSEEVEKRLTKEDLITIVRDEVTLSEISDKAPVIIASGPLTSNRLAQEIKMLTGHESLAFFDSIAPVIYKESIDFSKAWYQSRYDKGSEASPNGDYINCPLNKKEYDDFIRELLESESTEFKEWEKNTPYFEGCMPIEEMARRGPETLRFGPMKPVGLTDPKTGERPHAVVQLRQDNADGTLYNMVGFQTKARHSNQTHLFRTIPGLENAKFARLGGLHRNTFINSPRLLDGTLRLAIKQNVRFAGQITGVEGYIESAAIGLLAGIFSSNDYYGEAHNIPPNNSALCSLLSYITTTATQNSFQPMNINFGLFPKLREYQSHRGKMTLIKGLEKKKAISKRALSDVELWVSKWPGSLSEPSTNVLKK